MAAQSTIAVPVTGLLLIGGAAIFAFGAAYAVMKRALSDYKKTKEALPGLRKDRWRTFRAMLKIGVLVVIGYLIMVAWSVHEITDTSNNEPAKPRPSITDRWVHR